MRRGAADSGASSLKKKENRTMKRILTYSFAAALVLGAGFTAWAESGKLQRGDHGERREAFLTRVLDLSADQQAAVEKLHAEMKAKAEPLRDQRHQQMKEVFALLKSANPDPAVVGEKMIAAYATRQQMKTLHEEFESKLSALLTPDQQEKLQKFQERRKSFDGEGFGHRGGRHGGF